MATISTRSRLSQLPRILGILVSYPCYHLHHISGAVSNQTPDSISQEFLSAPTLTFPNIWLSSTRLCSSRPTEKQNPVALSHLAGSALHTAKCSLAYYILVLTSFWEVNTTTASHWTPHSLLWGYSVGMSMVKEMIDDH